MQFKVHKGAVDLSGKEILSSVDIEINDNSKIAVVGRNGSGKTTLLKLISGEYSLTKKSDESFLSVSGKPQIGVLSQITFEDENRSMIEEVRSAYKEILELKANMEQAQKEVEENQTPENIKRYTALLDRFTFLGGFYFEKEYESAIKKFGFDDNAKHRKISEFSGGQRTKIAFLKLLLSKPDILLLDEPTNHLDIEAILWLESYLKSYKKAFVIVSHDRAFLDNTVSEIYEIERGKTKKYAGNYTSFIKLKAERFVEEQKRFEAQEKEKERLNAVVERFRYKATKAAMAQSKIKQIEKMDEFEAPETADLKTFNMVLKPKDLGVQDILTVKNLEIGYDKVLSMVNLEMKKGDRVGIIGLNGLGKSTFIKTLAGKIPAISGSFHFGARTQIGYFDQQMALYSSNNTVLDDYLKEFPNSTPFEARSALGAFLFSGEDVFKTVDVLSGGERVRLSLCKIFKRHPNFLLLDEPTNHMDILGKEALEKILGSYEGTLLFVSHDRYFISKLSNSLLSFEEDGVKYYQYGYSEYLEREEKPKEEEKNENKPKSAKKSYTSPGKEKSRMERAVLKSEEKIENLENQALDIKNQLNDEANASDYKKLSELQEKLVELEEELNAEFENWTALSENYAALTEK